MHKLIYNCDLYETNVISNLKFEYDVFLKGGHANYILDRLPTAS